MTLLINAILLGLLTISPALAVRLKASERGNLTAAVFEVGKLLSARGDAKAAGDAVPVNPVTKATPITKGRRGVRGTSSGPPRKRNQPKDLDWELVKEYMELTPAARGQEPSQRTVEEQGFSLRRLEEGEMEELALFLDCTHPEQLGRGRDAKAYWRKYSELRPFAAWQFDVPDRADIYNAQKRIAFREMSRTGIKRRVHSRFDDLSLGNLEPEVNEKWLLHGTQPHLVMPIFAGGLDERLSSLGSMFGAGVYLSEDPEKVDQYVRPDDGSNPELSELHSQLFNEAQNFTHPGEDLFYVFVVRAVLGVPCYTMDGKVDESTGAPLFHDEHRRELGYIPGNKPLRYHCLIADTGDKLKRYREFVVYNGGRTNIRYMLAYRRV